MKDTETIKTAYRALETLRLLSNKSLTLTELAKLNVYNKNQSLQNVKNDIETIKCAGFKVIFQNNKYHVDINCTNFDVDNDDIKNLLSFEDNYKQILYADDFFDFYDIFDKLKNRLKNNENIKKMSDFNYFTNHIVKISKQLKKHIQNQSIITIKYDSPKGKIRLLKMIPQTLRYDITTEKLHVFGLLEDYPHINYLRVDKIIEIVEVSDKKIKKINVFDEIESKTNDFYIVKNDPELTLIKDYDEYTEMITNDFLRIVTNKNNKFKVAQKVIQYAFDIVKTSENIKKEVLKRLSEK